MKLHSFVLDLNVFLRELSQTWAPFPRDPRVVDSPKTWLPRLKSEDVGSPPIFDPDAVIKSMGRLRRSFLSKKLFGTLAFSPHKSNSQKQKTPKNSPRDEVTVFLYKD